MKLSLVFTLLTFLSLLATGNEGHVFTETERAWWAVQPLANPEPPKASDWSEHPVDGFVHARLLAASLEPAERASREELIRRATYDLHGLPPSPERVAAFVDDPSSNAWEAVIDELLASPRYGERWGQHWLDLVRYAETDGYRADDLRPNAYKYREYVIDAFNDDKPYDQFVREQLAGDELGGREARTATAFLRHGIYEWNQRNARMHWDLILHEMTRVSGETFLGLGIGCAQCHDHKFDPILQTDYYAMQAFFSTVAWPTDQVDAAPEQVETQTAQQELYECATIGIRTEMDALVSEAFEEKIVYTVEQFPADIQAMYNKPAAERSPYEKQMAYLVQRQVDRAERTFSGKTVLKKKKEELARWTELEKELKSFDDLKPKSLAKAFVATDIDTRPVPVSLPMRGKEVEIEPGFPALLGERAPEIDAGESSTGRRSALANWIVRPENPLSTRVIANRIWQYHFGRGLVATPNDFGTLGEPPSHPELLDWLARRFVEEGWTMKPMHRLIMTSETYRQTARRTPPKTASLDDPANTLLWRFPPRRLSAEEIRDGMLSVSGELKPRTGGSSVSGSSPVRSVYVTKRRNRPDPVLAAFDAPAGFDSSPTRSATTTPTQSLLMSNNAWPQARARAFARRLLGKEKAVSSNLVERAYQQVYARAPESSEREAAMSFLSSQMAAIEAEPPVVEDAKGYVAASEDFAKVVSPKLGPDAVLFRHESTFNQVAVEDRDWQEDSFTLEALAQLDEVYRNANVNTLLSRWNGSQAGTGGWTFGVTSAKSGYEPRNFIMQLVGKDTAGNISYEVIDSNIAIPLGKPYFLAAVVNCEEGGGTVTFYARDASNPKAATQMAVVKHSIVESIQRPDVKLCLSGRDERRSHHWDGPVGWVRISPGQLRPEQLMTYGAKAGPDPVFEWRFDRENVMPVPVGRWNLSEENQSDESALLAALTDFCHALMMSNEALYLH